MCWRLGALPELFPRFAIESANTHALELLLNAPVAAAVIAVFSIAIAVVLNRFGLRRSWSYLLFAIAVGCSAALMAAHFLKTPLLALPLLFSGALTILLVQVSRLWQVDRVLSSTLFTSPSGPGEQITDANTRVMSGLKLLNTMLPLNEAVVFQCADGSFEAVARFKGSSQSTLDPKRNSVWRKGSRSANGPSRRDNS